MGPAQARGPVGQYVGEGTCGDSTGKGPVGPTQGKGLVEIACGQGDQWGQHRVRGRWGLTESMCWERHGLDDFYPPGGFRAGTQYVPAAGAGGPASPHQTRTKHSLSLKAGATEGQIRRRGCQNARQPFLPGRLTFQARHGAGSLESSHAGAVAEGRASPWGGRDPGEVAVTPSRAEAQCLLQPPMAQG